MKGNIINILAAISRKYFNKIKITIEYDNMPAKVQKIPVNDF